MLQPRREYQEMAIHRAEGDTVARTYPGQLDPRRFVHRHGRTAGIAEDNLPAAHSLARWLRRSVPRPCPLDQAYTPAFYHQDQNSTLIYRWNLRVMRSMIRRWPQ